MEAVRMCGDISDRCSVFRISFQKMRLRPRGNRRMAQKLRVLAQESAGEG